METHLDLFLFSDKTEVNAEIINIFKSLCFNNAEYIKDASEREKLVSNYFKEKSVPVIWNSEDINFDTDYITAHIVTGWDGFDKSEKLVKQFSDMGFLAKIFLWADESQIFISCKPNDNVKSVDFENIPYEGVDDDEIDDLDFDEIDIVEKLRWWHEDKPELLACVPDTPEYY